jgi:hypothetical protein
MAISIQQIMVDGSPIGYTGSRGDLGFTGSQGTGFTGSAGFTGSLGFTGSQGEVGFTGSQGEVGFTGSQGGFFSIEAERSGSVALNDYFAFGNGAQAALGAKVPIACTLGYLTISAETTQTAITVELYVNGIASGQTVSLASSASAQTAELSYAISAGDTISFRCSSGSTNATTVVGAWFLHDGVKGYTGSQGDVGFTGSIGGTGFTGSIGYSGSQGDLGYTGSKGELGIAGFLADASSTVPNTTTEGHMWFDTEDLTLSIYYNDGDSSQWVTVSGERGLTGYAGSVGFTGSIGYTGSQGDTGFVGSRGDTGFTGSSGAYAAVGFTGSAGDVTTGKAIAMAIVFGG